MDLIEENYPMTYKEFEQRVVELFLEPYGDDVMDEMKSRVDDMLNEKPHCFLEMEYGAACFRYDSPHIYGDNCRKCFDDDYLKQTAVTNLRMIIG
jgi:hypothetical protein